MAQVTAQGSSTSVTEPMTVSVPGFSMETLWSTWLVTNSWPVSESTVMSAIGPRPTVMRPRALNAGSQSAGDATSEACSGRWCRCGRIVRGGDLTRVTQRGNPVGGNRCAVGHRDPTHRVRRFVHTRHVVCHARRYLSTRWALRGDPSADSRAAVALTLTESSDRIGREKFPTQPPRKSPDIGSAGTQVPSLCNRAFHWKCAPNSSLTWRFVPIDYLVFSCPSRTLNKNFSAAPSGNEC